MRPPKDNESWKRMVLRSQPSPAWLSPDAPSVDVVLSSRTRILRNLVGHRFPGKADTAELQEIMGKVIAAARDARLNLEIFKSLTNAERDYLVGCRLVSPDFQWTLPGRALLMDRERSVSLLVNEEDHLRIQALTAGWSTDHSDAIANALVAALGSRLPFAVTPTLGVLSASPVNRGVGRRQSAMLHLIGLANAKRLPGVMKALGAKGIIVRGLFGEASRAIGAFVQVSVIAGTREDYVGACEYLIQEERTARAGLASETVREKAEQAQLFLRRSTTITLADALRVLAWTRWAATAGVAGASATTRSVDALLTTLELRSATHEDFAARERADSLKVNLNLP